MASIHDLPVELLEIILFCLWADKDLHYMIARQVCRLWYNIYSGLVSRKYTLCKFDIIKNMMQYPRYLRGIQNANADLLNVICDICMRHGQVNECAKILRKHERNMSVALPYALKYNRRKFVWKNRRYLHDIESKHMAYIFYFHMSKLYEHDAVRHSGYDWVMPDINNKALKSLEGIAISILSLWHDVYETDTPERADCVRKCLHALFSYTERQRIYAALNCRAADVDAHYKYMHTLDALSDEYVFVPKTILASCHHYKNVAVWKRLKPLLANAPKPTVEYDLSESFWWAKKLDKLWFLFGRT